MLIINDKEYSLVTEKIKFVRAKHNNKIEGHTPSINIEFDCGEFIGFIRFFLGFYENNDFNELVKKKFNDIPTDLNSNINCIEICDVKSFIDFIDSSVGLEFKGLVDNKLENKLVINDELVKVEYKGFLSIE